MSEDKDKKPKIKTVIGRADQEIPNKEEHIEAYQANVNDARRKFVKTLSDTEQKKFAAVEKAIDILTEAGVPMYLYAHLAQPNVEKPRMWQFNNVFDVHGFNKDGSVQDISKYASDDMIRCMMESFYTAHRGNPLAWHMLQNEAIGRSYQRDADARKEAGEKEEDDD